MAIIRCSECRKEMSDTAQACPSCGAPIAVAIAKKPTSSSTVLMWVVGIFVLVLMMHACSSAMESSEPSAPAKPKGPPKAGQIASWVEGMNKASLPVSSRISFAKTIIREVGNSPEAATARAELPKLKALESANKIAQWVEGMNNSSLPAASRIQFAKTLIHDAGHSPEAAMAKAELPKLRALVEVEKSYGAWEYDRSTDEMTGKVNVRASVMSTNTLNLDFPYQGEQRGRLMIRKHPKYGNDVILSIERGQILCHTYGCGVTVRFDDGQPVTYEGTDTADGSSEMIFLPYSIAARIAKSDRVRVQVTRSPVLDFNTKGLKSELLKR